MTEIMGAVKSCCKSELQDKLMVTKMDLSHCGCIEVPPVVFNAERCIETLILASNQITSLPPQLFHCQEMKHLNLNDNCLTSIPPAIGSFQHLISLRLDKNNFEELPENLKMCKKLKRLSLNSNPWKQMPNMVTQLITLEELYMNDCELNYLPASIGRLAKLKIIELRNNNLSNLPLSMSRLESLTRLDISDNEFTEFPPCISKLRALTELLLDNNDIEEITDIKNLVNLEHLDASYNHIINISDTLGCCTNLSMLNLSFNYIEHLPHSIGNISNLQTLHLEMNDLTEIPKSIGNLTHLEELNLCNNKLYNLPNTIGLLRNLRNLNVSRNIIEELPPEIGSCTKLAIINAAYNRLQLLPSEIGYLNNLKVLDLVGNFLMYLPITTINLCGVRAIWLSANQNVPLIPFTEDLNLGSGERFLTNIALPQVGEIPLKNNKSSKKGFENEKTCSWNKKIRFAEDENILPGKLHRTPTPFPKELRAPNRRHRIEESRLNYNYMNIINGKICEPEFSLFHSPSVCTSNLDPEIDHSNGFTTRIREANIRKNNNVNIDILPEEDCGDAILNSDYNYSGPEMKVLMSNKIVSNESQILQNSVSLKLFSGEAGKQPSHSQIPGKASPCTSSLRKINDGMDHSSEQVFLNHVMGNYNENIFSSHNQQVIYSNLINNENKNDFLKNEKYVNENSDKEDFQKTVNMYHNEMIQENQKSLQSSESSTNCGNAHDGNPSHVDYSNSLRHSDNCIYMSSSNSDRDGYKRNHYAISAPSFHQCDKEGGILPIPFPSSNNYSLESERQDLLFITEQMKNRNISPPCYEIAKMYSTKAAFFENNRVDQVEST